MLSHKFSVRTFISLGLATSCIFLFATQGSQANSKAEENKSTFKKVLGILFPPQTPPPQGEEYCFVMPRFGHNETYTAYPRFIWQGSIQRVSIEQNGKEIWQKFIEEPDVRSVLYDGSSPLAPGFYTYTVEFQTETGIEKEEQDFYVLENSYNLNLQNSIEINQSKIGEIVTQGDRFWDANQVAYSTQTPEFIVELNNLWIDRCQAEIN
ncbi:MAG: hypothetical protein HC799_01905 [Limnothrix sp. RL_2_0]|nr:hypothetical protein [Limnothrix sp. RL_2_0]